MERPDDKYVLATAAVNKLIRSGQSWSGRERNVFYLNLGDGRFADLSGVAGLDFPEDGRAFGTLDFDGDGDLDLVVRNRNSPQLRVLRNDTGTENHRVAFRLVGRTSNRDAVGASVVLETPQGPRTKYVRMGSGFLSQSTKTLFFGLGGETQVPRARVTWPDGSQQVFERIPGDHRVTLVQGEADFTAEPFRPRNSDSRVCAPPEKVPPDLHPEGYPMVEPVALPEFSLARLEGGELSLAALRGQPAVLNFWATWCVPCQKEMALWKEHYDEIQAAGAQLAAISVDEPGQRAAVKAFVQQRALPFPVLHMDAKTLERLNLFYQHLFVRFFDLEIPTTFLLNSEGEVAKVYRGIVPVSRLLQDLETLQEDPLELSLQGLPYEGPRAVGRFGRDYFPLAAAFTRAGWLPDAAFYYRKELDRNPADATSWYHLGLVLLRQGDFAEAQEALQEALRYRPEGADVHYALGMLARSQGRPEEALRSLRRAVELAPDDVKTYQQAQRQLFLLLAELGRAQEAVSAGERYLELAPGDAAAQHALGLLYAQTGALEKAQARFEQALARQPEHAEALLNLGTTYARRGEFEPARATFQKLVQAHPEHARGHFNLARVYLRLERPRDARRALERYVALQPEDAGAHYDLGVLYLQSRAFRQAIQPLSQAAELQPDNADAHLALAYAYLETGRLEEARRSLHRVLGLRPDDPRARQLLSRLTGQAGSSP